MTKKLLLFLLPFLSCCTSPSPPQPKASVLVSVAPYAYFVRKIGGEDLPIHILIPEEANPHVYEPKPREVEAIVPARLWVRLGDPADQKMRSVFKERNPGLVIAEVTRGIALRQECGEQEHAHCHHDGEDLHIWLSPRLAQIQARTIAEGLILAFPEKKEQFQQGLSHFLKELEELDREITQELKPLENRAILVSHPAFAYFCQDYHLIQLSIEMEGKDPLPKDLTHLLQQARTLHVTAVLLQPQYSNKGAELMAKELDLPTATINPYAEDYVDNLRQIAQIIANSYKK